MALQLGALRDALLDAGANPAKADMASEEVAAYETRLASVESSLTLLKWMVGFNLVMTAALVTKAFV
jgi:hypothetical protein